MTPTPLTDLSVLIVFLGTPAFLQWLMSKVFEKWPWFQKQETKVKIVIFGALAILLPQLSWVLVTYVPPTFWSGINQNYAATMMMLQVVLSWSAGEVQHKVYADAKKLEQ